MNPIINIQNIYKNYHTKHNSVCALNNISLQIFPGSYTTIIGKSGSGKSTLMNIIGCLDTPTYGKYFLNGDDISKLDKSKIAKIRNKTIGFIFQNFNLISNLSAIENVELPLTYRKIPKDTRRQIAKQALQKVGLENRLNHRPYELSGGQQQRVAIARAIAGTPPIIVADEPTGNLDSKCEAEILSLLKKLHQSGHTLIIITHNKKIADDSPNKITIIDGKIYSTHTKNNITINTH